MNFLVGITRPRKLRRGKRRALAKPLQRAEDFNLVLNKQWVVAQAVDLKLSRSEAQTLTPSDFSCHVLIYPQAGPREHLKQDRAKIWSEEAASRPAGSAPETSAKLIAASQSNRAGQPTRDRIETDFDAAVFIKSGRTRQQAGNRLKLQVGAIQAVLNQPGCEHAPSRSKEPILERATSQQVTTTAPSATDAADKIPKRKLPAAALE